MRPSAQLIGVPISLGTDRHPGLEVAPGLLAREIHRQISGMGLTEALHYRLEPGLQTIAVPAGLGGHAQDEFQTVHYLDEVAEACRRLRDAVRACVEQDSLPVVLGGDHSLGLGSLAGMAAALPETRLGVVWVDNHPDLNTGFKGERFAEPNRRGTTPSGHIHGMSLAAALGYGDPALLAVREGMTNLRPQDVVLVGIRDLDPGERAFLHSKSIRAYTSRHVEGYGIVEIVRRTVAQFRESGVRAVHISFDIDALDAPFAPGTGTPVPGGLTFREADLLVKRLRDELPPQGVRIASFDLVEINPLTDVRLHTVDMGARLVMTVLGEEILERDEL